MYKKSNIYQGDQMFKVEAKLVRECLSWKIFFIRICSSYIHITKKPCLGKIDKVSCHVILSSLVIVWKNLY